VTILRTIVDVNHLNLPPIELLEATHQFPGIYIFKIIVREDQGITDRLLAAIEEEISEDTPLKHSQRKSAQGNHLSLTVEVKVKSGAHVHSIYSRVSKVEGIILIL